MEILIANHAGFCFGVKRAVDIVSEELSNKDKTFYSLGPLIHNPQVVSDLENKGLKKVYNIDDLENKDIVIRAHGVTKKEIDEIKNLNINILDGTCPYVKLVHKKVEQFKNKGYNIVIVGDSNHPEVIGINGWCSNSAFIVNNIEDVKKIPYLNKICIVSQTTNTYEKFSLLSEEMPGDQKTQSSAVFQS